MVLRYGRDFKVRFSSEKNKIMIVNRAEDERNATWGLEGKELGQNQEYKYLRIWTDTNGCDKAKSEN